MNEVKSNNAFTQVFCCQHLVGFIFKKASIKSLIIPMPQVLADDGYQIHKLFGLVLDGAVCALPHYEDPVAPVSFTSWGESGQ